MDSGIIELIAIIAPSIGTAIRNYIKSRGDKVEPIDLQIMLMAKSLEDLAFTKEGIVNLSLIFKNFLKAEEQTLKSIQTAMEEISSTQRRLYGNLVEAGVIK